MLTIRNIAVAQRQGLKGRPGYRGRSLRAALEGLEARSLLSTLAPGRSTYLDFPDRDSAIAEIITSEIGRQGDQARAVRPGDGNVLAAAPVERVGSGAAESSRRLNSQVMGLRGLITLLPLVSHGNVAASVNGGADLQAAGLELIVGIGGGDSIDPAGAASMAGWGRGTATQAFLSLANPSGWGVGPDGQAWPEGPGMGLLAAGTFGPDEGPARDLHAGVDSELAVADRDRGGPAPAWADILDSALHPDWEAVDGELRQFLGRLGDLDLNAVGPGTGPAWLVLIGAATAMILARRASTGRRLPFRRKVPWPVGVSRRHPVPVGPWPLGPP